MEQGAAEDYHADSLFCFPAHFVYVLQGRDLIMFDGILHQSLSAVHGMPFVQTLAVTQGFMAGVWFSRTPRGALTQAALDLPWTEGFLLRFLMHTALPAVAPFPPQCIRTDFHEQFKV